MRSKFLMLKVLTFIFGALLEFALVIGIGTGSATFIR